MLASNWSRTVLRKGAVLAKTARYGKPLINEAQRQMCGFVKDWEPGPPPRTPAEYAAAAKKYNMIPEDYEPGDPNMWAMGDYPELPYVSEEGKDPYDDYCTYHRWWNYGETQHWEQDALESDMGGANFQLFERDQFHSWDNWAISWAYVASMVGFLMMGDYLDVRVNRHYKPKQWPYENGYMGVKHYTFEPLYD